MTTKTFSEVHIPSAYQGLPITVYVRKGAPTTRNLLVLHPGAFESAWGDNDRYRKILLWLQSHLSSHPTVVSYETSRLPAVLPKVSLNNPQYWQKKESYWREAFAEKTFMNELDDVRRVYKYVQKNIHHERICVLGFSVGGTIAMILTHEIPFIQKLCVVGSAVSTKRPHLPILTGYPSKGWILKQVSSYKHYLKIMQGRRDTVVPLRDAEAVFHELQSPIYASFDRFAGADHMFSGDNSYGLFSYKTLLPHIKKFFELSL